MSDLAAVRKRLESDFGPMSDRAWSFLCDNSGPLDDPEYADCARDWLKFAWLFADDNRQRRPQPTSRAGKKRGRYVSPLKRRWRMVVFADDYGRPHDWQMIAGRWNEQTGEKVSAMAYERLYYKTTSEQWTPEWEEHVFRPIEREVAYNKALRERLEESEELHQFIWLIETSGSITATLDLGMHRVISARRDSSQFAKDTWEKLWDLVESAYDATDSPDPLSAEERVRVAAYLLAGLRPPT